jgi:hypothetical protein
MTEESVWSTNKTDDVIAFPITVSEEAVVKADLSALEHLHLVRETQLAYVRTGANEQSRCQHNVSCTVIVEEREWEEVTAYLYEHREDFCAISLIPACGDKLYAQAPMEAVSTEEDELRFAELIARYIPVHYTALRERSDTTNLVGEVACNGGKCEI